MRKFLYLLFLPLFLPVPGYAWDDSDHRLMVRFALEEVAHDWGLDRAVPRHPLQSLLDKIPLPDPQRFSSWLKINPKIDLEVVDPTLRGITHPTPLQILSTYSTDPDDGRDQDLQNVSPDQKWFGAAGGADSQAFRHIEKPPFRWRHPISTFGLPPRTLGEATSRVEIYFRLSSLAFSLGEEYWGWRFLAASLHYLTDLHNPFHAGQITPSLLVRGLSAYLRWGYKGEGLMGTLSHTVSNLHRSYESFVASDPKPEILERLKGKDLLNSDGTAREIALRTRDASNKQFAPLISAALRMTDEAKTRMWTITAERFEAAGRAIRTVVRMIHPTSS